MSFNYTYESLPFAHFYRVKLVNKTSMSYRHTHTYYI